MQKNNSPLQYSWADIEKQLGSLSAVSGGFSLAKRGLVKMPDGQTIFVKIGAEENSKRWAKKELAVYRYLASKSYPFIPKVLSENANKTGFALEALLAGDGWDWSDNWTVDRLEATLAAMDTLAGLNPENEAWGDSTEQALDATRNGWQTLLDSVALQQTLQTKLKEAGHTELAHSLDLPSEAERSSRFEFRTDTLVHYDVRADNCAWNPNSKEVMLVDWNWAQLGDKRMDMAAMLVNAQRGGLDVPVAYADRLDADALQWLAGFWFRGAATPIWEGGDETLRNLQLESGVRSLRLMSKIEES